MHCRICHSDVLPGANFCHVCGEMLRPFCRHCDLKQPEHSHYCFRCGRHLSSSAELHLYEPTQDHQTSPSQRPESNPRDHSSQKNSQKHTAEKLQGERKHVSVLFADISGFTRMSETMDPENVTDLMNRCFDVLGTVVRENEGFIDKFMGDCIMALFGAPITHENDPELSIRCALSILKRLEEFNQSEGLDLGISIGINSGVVVAGGVGSQDKFEYTVMGDTVNVAQRLQSLAEKNQILVSKNLFKATEHIFEFEYQGKSFLKGKSNEVDAYRVKALKAPSERKKARSGFDQIIGREKEIEIFSRCLEQVQSQRGQAFFISGEAGVGKSRFKAEMRRLVKAKDIPWHEAKCQPMKREAPYFLFTNLLSSIFGIEADDSISTQTEKVKAGNKVLLDEISEAFLMELLHLPNPHSGFKDLDQNQRKRACFLSIKKLLTGLAEQSPLCIYFEDLHWVDPLSKELLDQLIDSVQQSQLLIAGSYRSEFISDWNQKSHCTQIVLHPLSSDQSLDLVKRILKIEELPSGLKDLILSKADGNPLYIEEIIKSLIDTGLIEWKEGICRISEEIGKIEIPSSLHALIASRIDRLHSSAKSILQYASVIGREFSDLLLKIVSDDPSFLPQTLELLQKKELVFELDADIEEIIYIFKHALTQQVAYESILLKKRKLFHLKVAEAIERLLKNSEKYQEIDFLDTLAQHFSQTDEIEKSIHYLMKAADQMDLQFNNEGAIENYQKALSKMEDLENLDPKQRVEALFRLAEVQVRIGQYACSEEQFKKLLQFGKNSKDNILLAKVSRRWGQIERLKGNSEKAFEYLNQSLEYSKLANDFEGEVRTYKVMASVWQMQHRLPEALKFLELGLEGARNLDHSQLIAEYLNDLGIYYISKAEYEKSEAALTESLEKSTEGGFRSLQISSILNLGVVEYYRKNFESALQKFTEAEHIAQQIGDFRNILISKHNRAEILKEFERYDEALPIFQECLDLASDMGNLSEALNNKILIGHIQSILEKHKEAKQILEECINLSKEKQYWALYCDALYYLGLHYQNIGKPSLAKEAFQTSLKEAENYHITSSVERATERLKDLEKSLKEQAKNEA